MYVLVFLSMLTSGMVMYTQEFENEATCSHAATIINDTGTLSHVKLKAYCVKK